MKNTIVLALTLLLMTASLALAQVPSKSTDWLTIEDAAQRITNLSIGEGKLATRIAKLEAWRHGISKYIQGSLNDDLTKLTADSERAHKSLVSHAARIANLEAEMRCQQDAVSDSIKKYSTSYPPGGTLERIVVLERKVSGMQRAINALMSKTGTSLPSTTHTHKGDK